MPYPYPGDEYKLRRRLVPRPLRRASARRAFITTYSTGPKYYRRSSEPVAELEQPAEVGQALPDVHVSIPEIQEPVPDIFLPAPVSADEGVQFVEEPAGTDDVFVHLPEPEIHVPADDNVVDQPGHGENVFVPEGLIQPEQEQVLPEKVPVVVPEEPVVVPEAPVVVPEAPVVVPEVPAVEPLVENVIAETGKPAKDLSMLYDYMYPMVLRKCISSAMVSTKNADYGFQMKFIDHPLVQIAGLDTLEEIRRNMTGAPARRFGELPKMFSGCVFHFNEIDADMQEARDGLVMSYEEAKNEEHFHLDNKFMIKYEKLFKKQYMIHIIIRKLYELLKQHPSVYKMMDLMEADMDKYISYWNSKN